MYVFSLSLLLSSHFSSFEFSSIFVAMRRSRICAFGRGWFNKVAHIHLQIHCYIIILIYESKIASILSSHFESGVWSHPSLMGIYVLRLKKYCIWTSIGPFKRIYTHKFCGCSMSDMLCASDDGLNFSLIMTIQSFNDKTVLKIYERNSTEFILNFIFWTFYDRISIVREIS